MSAVNLVSLPVSLSANHMIFEIKNTVTCPVTDMEVVLTDLYDAEVGGSCQADIMLISRTCSEDGSSQSGACRSGACRSGAWRPGDDGSARYNPECLLNSDAF